MTAEIELWRTPDSQAYATIPVDDHLENWPVQQLRYWLMNRVIQKGAKAPGTQSVRDALEVLEAKALYQSPVHKLHVRTAEGENGTCYIDLCNKSWQVVEISSLGWRVVSNPRVKFRRSPQMQPLPVPVSGGTLANLESFLNLPDEASWKLTVAWLLASLRPKGGFPILLVNGEQGSSKTTFSRVLRDLVDPNLAPVRSVPRDERDLFISALNAWALTYDNLSGVPNWLSDAFCRLATGGGFSTRRLHTDNQEMVFSGQRPLILNGIPDLSSRADLVDRGVHLVLPRIDPEKRLSEWVFWEQFNKARPYILGALLDTLSEAMGVLPEMELKSAPRMRDFAELGVAAEQVLDWPEGSFLSAYISNREDAVHSTVEADPLAVALMDLSRKGDGALEFTPTGLLKALNENVDETIRKSDVWPKTPSALGSRVRRVAPGLSALGVKIDTRRFGKRRERAVLIQGKPTKSFH
ncbi:hypothetical protein [Fodinicurvata halophila]|uniref:hypothetical protein n=1 Tax=Fodinicurvata halophila TaxID=1419723 RepID=UPI0036D2358A